MEIFLLAVTGIATTVLFFLTVFAWYRAWRLGREDPLTPPDERRHTFWTNVGSNLITGLLVALSSFALQLVVAENDHAREARQRRDSLVTTLNTAAALPGLDARTLEAAANDDEPEVVRDRPDLCAEEKWRGKREESAVLRGIRLNGKNLDHANFSGMRLEGIDFSNASLRNATFCHAVLVNVSLQGANLANANLREARFESADLRFTKFEDATVWSVDYEKAKVNAETCWPTDFGARLVTRPGLEAQAMTNDHAGVRQESVGHECVEDEARQFLAGEKLFFATPPMALYSR